MLPSLQGRTLFITGASRGIGRQIALRAAQDGANIAVIAKTETPHPDLPGTIHSVAAEITKAGGNPLPIAVDIRDEEAVARAVAKTADHFGGIDILVNNASAIHFAGTDSTPLKRYDLMMDINTRGTFSCVQACLPYLQQSDHAHILTMSPPINLGSKWIGASPAYALSKYGMSILTMGFAMEFATLGIAANTLWPRSLIATDAIKVNFEPMMDRTRTPHIVADAAYKILCGLPGDPSGKNYIDEDVLRECGVTEFAHYAISPDAPLADDIFLD